MSVPDCVSVMMISQDDIMIAHIMP